MVKDRLIKTELAIFISLMLSLPPKNLTKHYIFIYSAAGVVPFNIYPFIVIVQIIFSDPLESQYAFLAI